jgi:hypothetical protein
VAAGVHLAVDLAAEGDVSFLVDGQRVHVGTQRDAPSGAAADGGDDAGFGDGISIRHAELVERGAHEAARLDLFVHQLGTTMELASQVDDPGCKRFRLVEQCHAAQHIALQGKRTRGRGARGAGAAAGAGCGRAGCGP